jgi:hypothetical protein
MAHLHSPAHQPVGSVVQRRATPAVSPTSARPSGDHRLWRAPGALGQQALLQLQRMRGNRHVQGMLAGPGPAAGIAIQAQADAGAVLQANGMDEEEAMGGSALQAEGEELEEEAEGGHALQAEGMEEEELAGGHALQAQEGAELEEEEAVGGHALQAQGMEEEEMAAGGHALQAAGMEDEEPMSGVTAQRRSDMPAAGGAGAGVYSQVRAAQGSGGRLDGATAQRFGAALGHSFEHVNVHTDATADQLSRSLGARAFTTGSDIFFRAGEYQPGTAGGDHLLAHELTHVVQQGQGLVPAGHQSAGRATASAATTDPFEREAEATADAFASHQADGGGPSVQRTERP